MQELLRKWLLLLLLPDKNFDIIIFSTNTLKI